MMAKKTKAILFIYLSLAGVCLSSPVWADASAHSLQDILKEFSVTIDDADSFVVQKDTVRSEEGSLVRKIVATSGEKTIKIEVVKNIDAEAALETAKQSVFVIQALYQRIPNPYPGMVSNTIECPDDLKPKSLSINIQGKEITAYILMSTARFTYGAYVDELIKYRGALIFIYEQELKMLFRLEIFSPKGHFDKEQVLNTLRSWRYGKSKGVLTNSDATAGPADFNVIIIGFEPLGVTHLRFYGYPQNTAPYLEAFAKNVFLFKNAVSPSSWTLPAFMSLFTSLYPSQHKLCNKYMLFTKDKQVVSNISKLAPQVQTLAQILKENGYYTAAFTGGAGVGREYGYDLGFDTYYDKLTFGGFDKVLPKAESWIRKHRDKKFFVFIQGYDVHGRHKVSSEALKRFAPPDYKGPYKGTSQEYWKLRDDSIDQKQLFLSPQDVTFWRAWYDAKIYEADLKFGNFLRALEEIGVTDRSIIVVCAGSGNEFFEHGRFDHGFSLYDELIHVPLMIKIPGANARVIEQQVRTIDIMPTILDCLGVACNEVVQKQMKGVSLAPLMKGQDLRLPAFSETDYLLQVFKRSLRTPDGWKFIYSMDTEIEELYNLNKDPQELHNLIDEESEIGYKLEQQLFQWLRSIGQDKKAYEKILKSVFSGERRP